MYRTFLSWRYLRARLTNLIGIVGILVGVGAMILILSIMDGFLGHSRDTIRGSLSDIVVQPLMLGRPDGRAVPAWPDEALELVRAEPGVTSACAQLTWYGILARGGREGALSNVRMGDPDSSDLAGVELVGIDVEDEYATTELRRALELPAEDYGSSVADIEHPFAPPPNFVPKGRPLPGVVVGEQLAIAWFLTRGSVIDIMTVVPDPDTGELSQNNRQYVVSGTFKTRENEVDLERIYFARDELADFLGGRRGYSQLLVKLDDYEGEGEAIRDRLRDRLDEAGLIRGQGSYEVRTWEQFRRVLLGAIENEKVLMAIMLFLVVIVAGFSVFAILSMMVTEKRRDIGILTALGATPRGVMSTFLLIAFWDALLGTTLGATLGVWGAVKIDAFERWLSGSFSDVVSLFAGRRVKYEIFDRDVYIFDHIPSIVDPLAVAKIVLAAFVCTLVFALLPAWKAARMDPLDALRYE